MLDTVDRILSLGSDANTPLEYRIPYRVYNLLLLIVSAGTLLTAVLAVTAADQLYFAILNISTLIGYMSALILMALKFTNAGRFLGIGIATISFCFIILAFRPNFTGVEFLLVGLMVAPIVSFTRAETTKIVVCMTLSVSACVLSFYLSNVTVGLFTVSDFEIKLLYYTVVFLLTIFVTLGVAYFNFGYVRNFLALETERRKTEEVLANALPDLIAQRLKKGETTIADSHAEAVVLFADIVGFSKLALKMSPRYIVDLLNLLFTRFDRLAEKHGVEKIKTIGDCYMAAGGLFGRVTSDGSEVVELALDMVEVCDEMARSTDYPVQLRIGIATGQVISGVISEKRTAFDIWGQTVNLASRMESTGRKGQIQVSESTYWRLKERYIFEKREGLVLKEGEEVTAFFLVGRA